MKIAEIRQIPTSELQERLATEKSNYEQMVLNHAVSPLTDSSKIQIVRRDIARMKTVLRQRELNK